MTAGSRSRQRDVSSLVSTTWLRVQLNQRKGELHKVIVEQLLHQLQDPIQSTLGYDLTRDFGRMMSPAQRGEYAAGHVVYVGLGTGTFHCGEEGIDRTTYTTLRQQLLDGSLPNDAADAQTTLASDAIFDLYLWD